MYVSPSQAETVLGTIPAFVRSSTPILFRHCRVTGLVRTFLFCGISQTQQRPSKESESIERTLPESCQVLSKCLWLVVGFILTSSPYKCPSFRADRTVVPRRDRSWRFE